MRIDGPRQFEAEADLEEALLEYFRSQGVTDMETLILLVDMVFGFIEMEGY